ncbi:MAG: hypothetical protein H6739_36920 [Alphaproteobacteria bacterium]|nr:hypothetical protein [Alphaproteobacteria bacterium]
MITRRAALLGLGALPFIPAPALAQDTPAPIAPLTLLASHLVVEAVLRVPVAAIVDQMRGAAHPALVPLTLEEPRSLFGEVREHPTVMAWHPGMPELGPAPERVLALHEAKVVAALAPQDWGGGMRWHFAGFDPGALQPTSPQVLSAAEAELARQAAALDRYLREPAASEPQESTVVELIAAMGDVGAGVAALGLTALGPGAAPSIIRHMDDRRPYGEPQLTLKGPGGQPLVYQPDHVLDALAAVLNLLTGVAFNVIYSGGNEAQRAHELRCWRTWRALETMDVP